MLEAVSLPQALSKLPLIVEAAELLRQAEEEPSVGIVAFAFHEQVDVLGHKDVRRNRAAGFRPRSQELIEHDPDGLVSGEPAMTARAAERQEIPLKAAVIEVWQVSGILGHAAEGSKEQTTRAG
jgi:hypothetical protein